jgi:predicted nucleic acid-binding protein
VELAALLAAERHLRLTDGAWEVARADLGRLRGRGRLTNARLVETYLDRGCSRHLSQAGETQMFRGEDALTLDTDDFEGVAAELEA